MENRKIYLSQFLPFMILLLMILPMEIFAQCMGGTVSMPSGATTRYTCPGDGNADVVMFVTTSTAATSYAYVITDNLNNILGLPPGNSQDFEGAGQGVCRVWGLSYTGNLTAMMGQNAATATLASGCFQLSSNFIEIVRSNPDGGTVAMPNGATKRYTCPGDGNADVVMFTHTTTSAAPYRYVITDDQNNILGLPPGNSQDFEGAGQGVCRVWGFSYTGNLTAMMGQNAATVALSDDCFQLSSNFIEIVRSNPDGGTVAMPSGATTRYTCPGDGNADVVMFTHTTTSAAPYRYVITDDQNNILGLPPGNSQDFEGAGQGVCRVWGLSYTGNVTAMMGQNAAAVALSDDCFQLSSNFIEVVRSIPNGGMVTSSNGNTTEQVCVNGSPDPITFVNNSTSTPGSQYQYIITDNNGNILAVPPVNTIDFDGAGVGTCRVYGASYVGTLTAVPGQNISTVTATPCFDLSSNYLTVVRDTDCQDEICSADDFQPGNTTAYAMLLNGIAGAPGNEYSFDSNGGSLLTYDDGTANLTGTMALKSDPNYSWEVNVWFVNKRNWTDWSALGRNYKGGRPSALTNHPNWDYYEFDIANAMLTGKAGSALAGKSISLTPNSANYTYGFQKGLGANDKNANYGASTWFNFSGSYSGFGDFNMTLACNQAPRLPIASIQFQTPLSVPLTQDLATLVYDPDGSPLDFQLAPASTITGQSSSPQFGTLALQTTGQFTYTPQAGFQGDDEFRFRAYDNATPPAFVEGTVEITVGSGVFPVTWVSFTAEKSSDLAVKLDWVTTGETQNDHFVIEKSLGQQMFYDLYKVDAQNSSGQNSYQFVDETNMGMHNYYRLKQVDQDGTFSYSSIVEVDFAADESGMVMLFPNPVVDILSLHLPVGSFNLELHDITGRTLKRESVEIGFAASDHRWEVNDLSKGLYFVSITDFQGRAMVKRFVKK